MRETRDFGVVGPHGRARALARAQGRWAACMGAGRRAGAARAGAPWALGAARMRIAPRGCYAWR